MAAGVSSAVAPAAAAGVAAAVSAPMAAAPAVAAGVAAATVAPVVPPVAHAPLAPSLQAAAPPAAAAVPPPAPVAPSVPPAGVPAAASGAAAPVSVGAQSSSNQGSHSGGQQSGPAAAQDSSRAVSPSVVPAAAMMPAAVVAPPMLFPADTSMGDMAVPGAGDLASLQAVISASGGSTVGWAAGMLATDAGSRIVVTTDRGRGWLPEHVLLPDGVVWPWEHEASQRWEGLLDPARVILEYAAASGGELTALTSTRASAPAVAAGVPFEVAEAGNRPRPDLLGGPLVPREHFGVTPERFAAAVGISDPLDQRRQAIWIAYEAVKEAGLTSSSARSSILTSLLGGDGMLEHRRISQLPWDGLVAENEAVWDAERAARVDVRGVGLGDVDTGGGRCREFLLQSYANEALLAINQASSYRALMGALYAWSMLLGLNGFEREDIPA